MPPLLLYWRGGIKRMNKTIKVIMTLFLAIYIFFIVSVVISKRHFKRVLWYTIIFMLLLHLALLLLMFYYYLLIDDRPPYSQKMWFIDITSVLVVCLNFVWLLKALRFSVETKMYTSAIICASIISYIALSVLKIVMFDKIGRWFLYSLALSVISCLSVWVLSYGPIVKITQIYHEVFKKIIQNINIDYITADEQVSTTKGLTSETLQNRESQIVEGHYGTFINNSWRTHQLIDKIRKLRFLVTFAIVLQAGLTLLTFVLCADQDEVRKKLDMYYQSIVNLVMAFFMVFSLPIKRPICNILLKPQKCLKYTDMNNIVRKEMDNTQAEKTILYIMEFSIS